MNRSCYTKACSSEGCIEQSIRDYRKQKEMDAVKITKPTPIEIIGFLEDRVEILERENEELKSMVKKLGSLSDISIEFKND